MKLDDKEMATNIVMIAAFVAAVDGCALYSLKRANIRPVGLRILWALIILLLPAVGALAFFFLRPSNGCFGFCLSEQEPVGDSPKSAASSCSSTSPVSPSGGEPTTPRILKEIQLGDGKMTPTTGSPGKWMFAPSS